MGTDGPFPGIRPEHPGPQALLAQAGDPGTPPDELRRLYRHPMVARLRLDAKLNPYVYPDYLDDTDILPSMLEAYVERFESNLARNPSTPHDLRVELARAGFGSSLAHNPNATPEFLQELFDGVYGDQPALQDRDLLANPATPPAVLERIALRAHRPEDREAVLNHPTVSAEARATALFLLGRAGADEATLRPIVRAGGWSTLWTVARYAGTPATILADLLASNPSASLPMLATIAGHPNANQQVLRGVADILARRFEGTTPGCGWDRDLDSPDPAVNPLVVLLAHPATDPDTLAPLAELLAVHALPWREQQRLATDPHTDPATLTLLAKHSHPDTLVDLAANPATPQAVLEGFAPRFIRHFALSQHLTMCVSLAANPAAPPGLLRQIYTYCTRVRYPAVIAALAENPSVPPDLRDLLGPRHLLDGHTKSVNALAVAPDATWLASVGLGSRMRIWDVASGGSRPLLTGHPVTALAVAPDGTWLAGAKGIREIWVWDAASGERRHILSGLTVDALAVAPDSTWLAAGGGGSGVRVWNAASGDLKHELTGHTGRMAGLAVAPDGSWLASADRDDSVRIWDLADGSTRHVLTGHTHYVSGLAVAPDGSWLASAGHDGMVRIWDLADGRARHVLTGHTKAVTLLAMAPDGSWLASAGLDGPVRIWDPGTGRLRHTLADAIDRVTALVAAPDGGWLAGVGITGPVRIWNPVTGLPLPALTDHPGQVTALAVAPDGGWLATGASNGWVRLWDLSTGQPRPRR